MPIKEIMALSAIIMASIIAANPTNPRAAIRRFEMRILKEAT